MRCRTGTVTPLPDRVVRFLILQAGFAALLLVTVLLFHQYLALRAWLLWNVFLAALPLAFAIPVAKGRCEGKKALTFLLLLAWLLFYPNAPYMLTDLVHLSRYTFYAPGVGFLPDAAAWFGLIHLSLGIATGCGCGAMSLYLLHRRTARRRGALWGWLLVAAVSCLSGFAIYLGRFLRFNTWDLVTRPQVLLNWILREAGGNMLLHCFLFACMSFLIYLTFHITFHSRKDGL